MRLEKFPNKLRHFSKCPWVRTPIAVENFRIQTPKGCL
ncbi:hypothetical protein BN938_2667 [Mucinivorans hirudinis]|uniref:Uncharacterized protein n=1 Tax=Mucinivorans hirudinis TaxID=1433126 RepID=A0A060RAR3_9BACT|nr:hypothetical protein BN938_2667 [Mucinivorans hirudinis]